MNEKRVKLVEWLRSGKYLPAPLRGFHDQKDVFKTLWRRVSARMMADPRAASYLKDLTWVSGQVFVIDHFLWFMAQHGWTLQRARVDLEFDNLSEAIESRRQQDIEAFKAMLEERKESDDGVQAQEGTGTDGDRTQVVRPLRSEEGGPETA